MTSEKYSPVTYEIINELPWIADLDFSYIKKMPGVQQKKFLKNSIIIQQDTPNDWIYYIDQGRVRMDLISPEGDEKTIAIVTEGNIFGEISALDGFNTNVSVIAITEVILYLIKNDVLLSQGAEVVNKLIISIARKNRLYVAQLEALLFKDALSRLVTCLYGLAIKYGIKKGTKIFIPVKFTHQQMALLLGCSRVTTTNMLNKLKEEKLIAYEQGSLVILNVEKLNKLANIYE